ncbi:MULTISPECIES: Lrp/AsnC family transcriptional regulator [unclassified Rhizobium]|uniref:Lrp/AsnC family transcriptional regulator n=1 Tax=unclassified Rhizobium TaxID=2613769 RepID=UPI0006FDD96B|nr:MULTISPECIES: Lrp/AsnC family transcriptional regulator [unclassified Rhizobium]KQV40809.1 AsnC family transcriptional regulator [Rhizobium sp. Root1212]KRD36097.1 AsnC family transcriptional regulator [Rhizobium sp. Root268]
MKRLLDRADDRILSELARNARIPHAELAEKINLSRNAVRQRIERLERSGVIQAYTIVTGDGRGGGATMVAMMFVYRHDRMRGGDVIQALKSIPEVVSCDVMSGEFDLVVRVEAGTADRIREIWQAISAVSGVRDTVTAFALSSMIKR